MVIFPKKEDGFPADKLTPQGKPQRIMIISELVSPQMICNERNEGVEVAA